MINKYNNTYHSTIKIRPFHIKPNNYIYFSAEKNKKHPKVGAHVQISKYKNILAKVYTPNGSKEMFVLKRLKCKCRGCVIKKVSWTYVI